MDFDAELFAKGRLLMHYALDTDDGLYTTYHSNIAMMLHDRYGIIDRDVYNQMAQDILQLIFDLARPPEFGNVQEVYLRPIHKPEPNKEDAVFINHIHSHLEPGQEVVCKICGKKARDIIMEGE